MCLLGSCATWSAAGKDLSGAARAEAIYAAAGMPAYASSPIQALHMDGLAWGERSLRLIEEAEDYILVCTFLLTEHPNSLKVLEALAAAQARGVRVKILVDSASYYRTLPMRPEPVYAAIQTAKELGLEVQEFNPIRGRRIFTLFRLLDRDHRKFWIIDGKKLALGGQNIDADSLRDPGDSGCIDAMVEFSSPGAIEELRDSFIASWNDWSDLRLDPRDFPVRAAEGPARVRIANQGPPGYPPRVTPMFEALFESAERDILLIQCYAFMTPSLVDRVRRAVERGVRVRFILSAGHLSPRFVKGSYYGILDLLEAGAEVGIWESPEGSLLHAKIIAVDGKTVSIGSANYNFRSEKLSREISAIFSDPVSASAALERIAELEPDFRMVDREEAMGYRGPDYLFNFLLMQLGG